MAMFRFVILSIIKTSSKENVQFSRMSETLETYAIARYQSTTDYLVYLISGIHSWYNFQTSTQQS